MARYQNVYPYTRTGRGNGAAAGGRRSTGRNDYVYGNVALQPDIRRQLEEEPRRKLSNEARKNRDKAHHMSLGYVAFLVAALCLAGLVLVNFIQLQSEITNMAETVADKELQLNSLKVDNDEVLNRINGSINMEEIREIAIGELGMVYAQEGQIEKYSFDEFDYLRYVGRD